MSEKINPDADGLIVGKPDITTQEEIEAFRAYYAKTKGKSLPGFEFLLENRPDVLKRYRSAVRITTSEEWRAYPLQMVLQHFHQYTITGYGDGIDYQVHVAQAAGASKAMLLEVLAIAFLHSGPRGMNYVAQYAKASIDNYVDPEPGKWPDEWDFDISTLQSGMDFSKIKASKQDIERLNTWYIDSMGEIPGYVKYLGKHNPDLLKGYRNRFEYAMKGALPRQMMPYLMLNYNASRGFKDGIREMVLLGKAFGMTSEQLNDAISWGFYYGGIETFNIVEEAVGELMENFQD